MREVLIEAEHGGRIEVQEGQFLEIINVEGHESAIFSPSMVMT